MFQSAKGIVLHSRNYSETSAIVGIYTDLSGLQSYIFKGIRKSKSRIRPALFQPLNLLEMEVYHKERQSLHTAKEVRLAHPYQTLPFDIRKSSIALFINEMLYKSIREEEANPELFDFLWNACLLLDAERETVVNFHLVFALSLTRYLGIQPRTGYSMKKPVFNMKEGLFQQDIPDHPWFLDPAKSLLFERVLQTPLSLHAALTIPATDRNALLEHILEYYAIHLPGFREMHSHLVLHTVLS